MNICIVIPAYNESQNIGPLIESLCAKTYNVIVIDDGSTDETGVTAKEKGAIVIRHDKRSGKGYSLRKGFEYALHHDYEAVITMDGDGQHDISDLGQFIEAAQKHKVSIITGNRMQNSQKMPVIRYCTNRCMSWLISRVCKQKIIDTQCGYRYISCDILREIHLTSRDFEIETEILIKACKQNFKVYNVPIKTIYCGEKSQINPVKDTVRFIVYFIKEICWPES